MRAGIVFAPARPARRTATCITASPRSLSAPRSRWRSSPRRSPRRRSRRPRRADPASGAAGAEAADAAGQAAASSRAAAAAGPADQQAAAPARAAADRLFAVDQVLRQGQQPADAKEVCLTVKEARLETGQFLAGAALIEQAGEEKKLFRITLPLGMQLPQGTRMLLDKEQPLTGRYIVCLPNGCMADFDVNAEFVGKLKKGQQIVLQGINLPGQAASYMLPLTDFAKANEGPATDPKKFEEDQKKLQDELQKKAEEARKRLQASRRPAPARRRRRRNSRSFRAITQGAPPARLVFWRMSHSRLCLGGLLRVMLSRERSAVPFKAPSDGRGHGRAGGLGAESRADDVHIAEGLRQSAGVSVIVDDDRALSGWPFPCVPDGCVWGFPVDAAFVARLRTAQSIRIEGTTESGRDRELQLPLVDFARAIEGRPTAPK